MVGICGITVEIGLCTSSIADDTSPYAGMKKGSINAVMERAIRIDRTDFELAAQVEITDQYRRPVLLKDLESGHNVFFLVDQKNKITKVILLIPS
ncbi:MAG: hypothetical protein HP496_07005 [Nitrospira sp.]|nr:hypothetical protein [Nitrospira sp.]